VLQDNQEVLVAVALLREEEVVGEVEQETLIRRPGSLKQTLTLNLPTPNSTSKIL
jgi:hypothetical protein